MYRANTSTGVISNIVFEKTGKLFSRKNMEYISGLCNDLHELSDMKAMSTSDKLVKYLHDNNMDYMVLLHDPIISAVRNDTHMQDTNGVQEDIPFSKEEQIQVEDFVTANRIAYKCLPKQLLMMGVAWVIPSERILFGLYPEVITVDTTNKTNNEQRPLLTISAKSSTGKMFTVLRAFLPNEQNWVFRWVFSVVLPRMFGHSVLSRIQTIISDGDSQEFGQIDNAIRKYLPHLFRTRCGWHIIEKGWQRKMIDSKCFPKKSEFYDKVAHQIKSWMYSWMKDSCESKEEYEYSKSLLIKYVQSDYIKKNLGELFIDSFLLFFRQNIEPLEAFYVFYLRKDLRHYGEYSNSIHEGTNRGLKFNAAPVTPATRLDKTTVILSKNGVRSSLKKQFKSAYEFCSTRPHSKNHHLKELLDVPEARYNDLLSQLDNYHCKKVDKNVWLVIPTEEYLKEKRKSIIPQFQRVRTVKYTHGVLKCTCPRTDVYGDICVHSLKVANSCPGWKGCTHNDFSVVWWKQYEFLTKENHKEESQDLSKALSILRCKEVCGIRLNPQDFEKCAIYSGDLPNEFKYDSMNPVCANFKSLKFDPEEDMEQPVGLTQISNITFDDNSEDFWFDEESIDRQLTDNPPDKIEPYSFLISAFRDMCNNLEGNCTFNDLVLIRSFLNEQTLRIKQKFYEGKKGLHLNEDLNKGPCGTLISSNVPNSKRKRTHGNKFV